MGLSVYKIFLLFVIPFSIYGSEIPNFENISESKGVVFFLSTPKSGTNLISISLSAITRKPIFWFAWKNQIFDPSPQFRKHASYNRLGLPFISDKPLLFRTHDAFLELMQVPSDQNKLIFITRNPKELMYRAFFLQTPSAQDPDPQFIKDFLNSYLWVFKVYDTWFPENRTLVFYEDFIVSGDDILVDLLSFMNEEPVYLTEFLNNKKAYMSKILESYAKQHTSNGGGSSSSGGPKAIYYTRNADPETLLYIDEYIENTEPLIWEKYLKKFQFSKTP